MKRYLTLVLLLFTLVAAGCTPASPTNSQPQKQQTQTQQQQPGETKQGQDTKSQTDTKETPVANLPTIGDTQADWENEWGQEDGHLRRTGKPADRQSEDLCRLIGKQRTKRKGEVSSDIETHLKPWARLNVSL